jgi:hypothetical protein
MKSFMPSRKAISEIGLGLPVNRYIEDNECQIQIFNKNTSLYPYSNVIFLIVSATYMMVKRSALIQTAFCWCRGFLLAVFAQNVAHLGVMYNGNE